LLVPAEEMARRAKEQPTQVPTADRGYRKLFLTTVTQADKGVDFDFLASPEVRGKLPRT
jgi:dihydroxy-acid dehydratase